MGTAPIFEQAQLMRKEFQEQQETTSQQQPITLTQKITLTNVSFSFKEKSTLDAISCEIPANAITAIVGASGAGKSTLADLLLGLLIPTQGQITIDNKELSYENMQAWREQISYVPQDAYFFSDTIRKNLYWVAPHATDEMVWQILTLTAAKDFINNLPYGLDTVMGERGVNFSGGEKQRLALARALLRQPKVLLLDEATSALDTKNEEFIYQLLKNLQGKITIIVIAHRYTTIRDADHVLVLQEGKLVESGNPQQLLSTPTSAFSDLFSK
jgi:ATP-binding cassette subfamily C protein